MNLMEAAIAAKLGGGGGGGLTEDVKQAFLNAFAHVAWTDEHGQDYYDALEVALYPIDHIAAVYTQSGTVYDTDSLDSLKADLVVTAFYLGGGSKTVTTYTLSGTLTAGTSTITVSYGGKTTTFTVTVTASSGTSDMNGWTDGVPYTNLTIVENEYFKAGTGQIIGYAGWNRTGYVPINGAGTLTIGACPQSESGRVRSNAFFDQNKGFISEIELSKTGATTHTVPANAYYFGLSSNATALATCIANGITPHAPINE